MDKGALGREYAPGDVICRQGEPGDRMYVIQAGEVDVVREVGQAEVVVGRLAAGDVFGEMAIIERQPRSATVRARGQARVLTLDKRAFLTRVHEDPSLAYRILESMSQRIRRLDEEVARLELGERTPGADPEDAGYLLVVSRERTDLCDRLTHALGTPAVNVLLDRRNGERRQSVQPPGVSERRQGERRRRVADELLRSHGLVLIPRGAPAPRAK